jgi:hypothetical protein
MFCWQLQGSKKMINPNIVAKAEGLKIENKFDWKRVKHIKKDPPKYLRKAVEKNEMVILGNGELKDYYKQPLIVIPLNDFFAMLLTCDLPKRKRWRKQGRAEHEKDQ